MSEWEDDPFDRYAVVVNHEEQYSIWPVVKPLPEGWSREGVEGSRAECLAHIDAVWTDIRPRSLRLRMQEGTPGADT
jgi:MbtH protein